MKATENGTAGYKSKFAPGIPAEHYRFAQNWWIASIGVGTYLGETDDKTDQLYTAAIERAVESGSNLLDTAINYRFQRSERCIGAALRNLISAGKITRDQVVLSSKAGFLTFDGEYPANPARYFQQEYIDRGICKPEDIVANCHCMTPRYLENQLSRSLSNLGVECIDIYFVHNPETQLSEVSRPEFLNRMQAAFALLEEKVKEGKIQIYGTATWDGYRGPEQGRSFLSLEELMTVAQKAGGKQHHFRALQLPYNLGMPEAFLRKNQRLNSKPVSTLEAAKAHGMVVLASASILQGQLASNIPESIRSVFPGLKSQAQASIQFVRSTPGITSSLVGMSQIRHVDENMQLARIAPAPWDQFKNLFKE